MNKPIEIFFSYAHKDEELMNSVRRQLTLFERRKEIKKWHDRQIPPGSEWEGHIDQRLNSSEIVLLFVSPHFIDSDYAYDVEMTEALRRHEAGEARVIPIILRPCPWKAAPFSHLQVLPKDGIAITEWQNEDIACLNVAQGIMSVVSELNDQSIKETAQVGSGKADKDTVFSVVLAELATDDKRRISFGISRAYESEEEPFYIINFVLKEKVENEFQDRVRLNIRVSRSNNEKVIRALNNFGLEPTQLQFLQGPVMSRVKSLPFGTKDDKRSSSLVEQTLRQ
jgi:hypothetical protein